MVVLNDTRVFAARLLGEKVATGGRVEVLLLERLGKRDALEVFRAIGRASKGLKVGTRLHFSNGGVEAITCQVMRAAATRCSRGLMPKWRLYAALNVNGLL